MLNYKNYIKENLFIFICKAVLSAVIAIAVFLDSRLSFSEDIYAPMEKIFFYPVSVKSLLMAFIAFVISFVIISLLELIQSRIKISYTNVARKAEKKDYIFFISSIILLICAWSPYFLSYFPGGIYPDTAQSFSQAVSNIYNNQQPVLYALIIKLCILICGELKAMALFTILQTLIMAVCFSYILFRLRLHNVTRPALIALFVYFAIFNLVPLYVVSLWKDTIFSAFLLMYLFLLTERILLCDSKPSAKDISTVTVFMLLTIFLRNNGLYVMIATTIILLIVFRKTLLTDHKPFIITTVLALIISFIIQGPVFNAMKINSPFVENLGIMQQELSYAMLNNGDFTDDDYAFLCQIMPFDDIGNRDYYRPFDIDSTKWSDLYNSEFLEENKLEFLKIWFKSFFKNPRLFLDAHLYMTLGYWDPFRQLDVSYTNPEAWADYQSDPIFWQKDYISMLTGSSIRNMLSPKLLLSSALFLFASLILLILSIKKKDKTWICFVPAIITYMTVFIATPLAFALRYVYILVLALPIFIFYAFCDVKSS